MKKTLLSIIALGAISSYASAGETLLKSKASLLQFNGKHYLGFVQKSDKDDKKTNGFETRRNYFQVKAYFNEDSKNHFRLTLDTHQPSGGGGTRNIRLKYAFLYLDDILPYTGVEIGQSHRPWHDYVQGAGWNYRSIYKIFAESKYGAGLTASADVGVNFRTNMENFSSELGIFNGEGYSKKQAEDGLSLEWRLTYHVLGGGDKKAKSKNRYTNLSFFGQQNGKSGAHEGEDLNWYGFHGVYNQPEFLIAAEYITTTDATDKYAGKGYSANAEYRFMPKYNLIGRYDSFEMDKDKQERKSAIVGVAYKYSKNIEFIANVLKEQKELEDTKSVDDTSFMVTAEVKW